MDLRAEINAAHSASLSAARILKVDKSEARELFISGLRARLDRSDNTEEFKKAAREFIAEATKAVQP